MLVTKSQLSLFTCVKLQKPLNSDYCCYYCAYIDEKCSVSQDGLTCYYNLSQHRLVFPICLL